MLAFRVDDQVLVRQLGDRHRRITVGQPAARRHGEHQPLLAQHGAFDSPVVAADAAEADVDTASLERLDLLHRHHLHQLDVQLRGVLAQLAHQRGDAAVQGGGDEANRENTPLLMPHALGRNLHLLYAAEDLQGLFEEQLARIAKPQRTAGAGDQGHAQFLLQQLDLAAQRRLGDMQLFGSAGEVALAGDGDEIAQLTQVHG